MKWFKALVTTVSLCVILFATGCQSKKESKVKVETDDAKYEVEVEKTEK